MLHFATILDLFDQFQQAPDAASHKSETQSWSILEPISEKSSGWEVSGSWYPEKAALHRAPGRTWLIRVLRLSGVRKYSSTDASGALSDLHSLRFQAILIGISNPVWGDDHHFFYNYVLFSDAFPAFAFANGLSWDHQPQARNLWPCCCDDRRSCRRTAVLKCRAFHIQRDAVAMMWRTVWVVSWNILKWHEMTMEGSFSMKIPE